MMDADKYQLLAGRTLLERPDHMPNDGEYMLIWNALRRGADAGAIQDACKKGICHRHGAPVGIVERLAAPMALSLPQRTLSEQEYMQVWNLLGLGGEVGEIITDHMEALATGQPIDREHFIKEAGDALWYIAALCTKVDVSLSEVMERNIAKLQARYPDGYSSADSKARKDLEQ
jgi:NTP pyrophosphatase (non-canonical NTP hydrolase)